MNTMRASLVASLVVALLLVGCGSIEEKKMEKEPSMATSEQPAQQPMQPASTDAELGDIDKDLQEIDQLEQDSNGDLDSLEQDLTELSS